MPLTSFGSRTPSSAGLPKTSGIGLSPSAYPRSIIHQSGTLLHPRLRRTVMRSSTPGCARWGHATHDQSPGAVNSAGMTANATGRSFFTHFQGEDTLYTVTWRIHDKNDKSGT